MSGGLLSEGYTGLPEAQQGATLGESVGAAAREAFLSSPMSSLLRENELNFAYDIGKPVDAATARQRIGEAGLDGQLTVGDQGISDLALEVLIERKRAELKRREAIETGPQGFGPGAARFAGAFGASLLDPLNIASAFVPVVGEARYAQLLARAGSASGRAGVRAGVGAAEGVVGAALVEPLIMTAKEQEQADYTMADSLANIAFGSVFGGGLHVTGGLFADAFRPASYWKSTMPDDIPGAVVPQGTFFGDLGEVKVGDQYLGARWALVDAAEIEASVAKADNQFRDRSRAASDTQVLEIANKLDFKLLEASPVMDFGAPTLAKDGRIIGGNGRMLAIGKAYEQGSAGPYTEALLGNLQRYGISPEQARGMRKPALVRVLEDDVDVRAAAMASNEGGSARMSALEQAGVDAGRLPDMRALDIGEAGQILSAGNRGFIRSWVGEFPKTQQPALLDADGGLSAEGLTRLRNAILLKAYGDSPTLRRLVEATDPGSRNVAAALTRAAPRLAETADAIKSGDLHSFDISKDIQAAVEKLALLREKDMPVGDYLRQGQLVADELGPEARLLLSFMDRNIRSPRAIADLLTGFYDGVRNLGNPKQAGMFGDALPSVMDLLLAAERRVAEGGASAADTMARVAPETREAAMRVALSQDAEGKVIDVEALVMADPRAKAPAAGQTDTPPDYNPRQAQEDLRAAAQRQLLPESDSLAYYATPRGDDAEVPEPPAPNKPDSELEAAEASLAEALGRIERSSGQDKKTKEAIAKAMKPYDEALELADLSADVLQAGAQCMGRFS